MELPTIFDFGSIPIGRWTFLTNLALKLSQKHIILSPLAVAILFYRLISTHEMSFLWSDLNFLQLMKSLPIDDWGFEQKARWPSQQVAMNQKEDCSPMKARLATSLSNFRLSSASLLKMISPEYKLWIYMTPPSNAASKYRQEGSILQDWITALCLNGRLASPFLWLSFLDYAISSG